MKVKFRQKTAMAVALLLMAMAAFLLPSNIPGLEWAKAQAQTLCYHKQSCTYAQNVTCEDDACDGTFMGSSIIGTSGRYFKQDVFQDGYYYWNEGETDAVWYQTRACIRSSEILCEEDDDYMKIVDNGAVGFVITWTKDPINPIPPQGC